MPNVLFICTGNVCRSPMAEGMFREMVESTRGLGPWEIGSAGISTVDGQVPSDHSVTVLQKQSINITGIRSRQLTADMIEEATHIFVMTASHKQAIEMIFPAAAEKTFLILELATGEEAAKSAPWMMDVPDPIGQSIAVYEDTRALIQAALPSVLEFVRETGV